MRVGIALFGSEIDVLLMLNESWRGECMRYRTIGTHFLDRLVVGVLGHSVRRVCCEKPTFAPKT